MGKKQHPLAARIKKIMQADEDVGKIAQITPFLIGRYASVRAQRLRAARCGMPYALLSSRPSGRAMELFLEKLCTNAGEIATSRSAKTVSSSHV